MAREGQRSELAEGEQIEQGGLSAGVTTEIAEEEGRNRRHEDGRHAAKMERSS